MEQKLIREVESEEFIESVGSINIIELKLENTNGPARNYGAL